MDGLALLPRTLFVERREGCLQGSIGFYTNSPEVAIEFDPRVLDAQGLHWWDDDLKRQGLGLHVARGSIGHARLAGADGEWDLRLVYDGNDPICCAEIEKVKRNPALSGRVSFADTTAAGFDTNDPANAGLDFELAEGKIITVHRDKKGECNHFLDEKGVGAFESARHAWFHVDAPPPEA